MLRTVAMVGLVGGLLVSSCASTATRATSTTTLPSTTTSTSTTTTTVPPVVDFHRPLERARPLRVLVVGDSVGISFARGLQLWAQETGGAFVRDDAREWCSLGRSLPRKVFGPQNSSAGCDDWAVRWAADVRTFDPDVVFVMYSIWEVVARKLTGATDFTRPGDPALDAWQLSEYQQAADVLSARGARVAWFSIACESDTSIARGEPLWFVNRRTIPALARSRPLVRLIDLDGLLCGGARVRNDFGGVADIRPDLAHYSEAGALAVSRRVMSIILGTTPAPLYAQN